MNCFEVQRILPEIIEGTQIQDAEIHSHLKTCSECSEIVSDLQRIARESRQLAACDEPPARVWVRIAAELRAEGIIHEPAVAVAAPNRPVLVPARARHWNPFWALAPVAVAILAVGSYFVSHKATPSQVAQQPARQQPVVPQAPEQPPVQAAIPRTPRIQPPVSQPNAMTAKPSNPPVIDRDLNDESSDSEQAELSSPPAADDQQFLSEVSQHAPTMRATYQNQLQAVNNEIRETQVYIKRHPEDFDARQHLMETYQQKAMLYQMALDRIQ